MITGIEPLTVLSLLTLASAEPSAVCRMPKPTQINVIPSSKELVIDTSQTREEIQKYDIDTVNPYGFGAHTHTNGFMRGRIGMQPRVEIDYKYVLGNRALCIWYDRIDLNIEITPEIVIAKEVAEDPCEYKAVKEHEMKHVSVDRKIVNKYAKTMGAKVHEGLKSRGFMVGPVSASVGQGVIDRMQQTVGELIKLEYKKMEIERAEKQQAVDTLEEYERVANVCKGSSKSKAYGSRHRH